MSVYKSLTGKSLYRFSVPAGSTVAVSGFIAFKVIEPMSNQKLWLKKIEFNNTNAMCETVEDQPYKVISQIAKNCLLKALEIAYGEALGKADMYFNAQEMALVKNQSKELREKKVY